MEEATKAKQPIFEAPKQGRRYEAGIFPIYDRYYNQVISREWPSNPERVIEIIEGNEEKPTGDGKVARMVDLNDGSNSAYTKNSKKARLEALKPKFKELEEKHEFQSYELVRAGESLAPDTSWSGPLLEELLELQAQRDAYRELARQAREKIELQKEKAKQEKQENILKYGLSGEPILPHKGKEHTFNGVPNAQKVVEVDGQSVEIDRESHVPFISEPQSPYHEMILMDYKEMAEAWRKEHGLDEKSIEDLNEERLAEDKNEINYKQLYRQKGLTEDSFPEWPEEARKIEDL